MSMLFGVLWKLYTVFNAKCLYNCGNWWRLFLSSWKKSFLPSCVKCIACYGYKFRRWFRATTGQSFCRSCYGFSWNWIDSSKFIIIIIKKIQKLFFLNKLNTMLQLYSRTNQEDYIILLCQWYFVEYLLILWVTASLLFSRWLSTPFSSVSSKLCNV